MNAVRNDISQPLTMTSLSAKQESNNKIPPARTSYPAVEAQPLHSFPLSSNSNKVLGNGHTADEDKKREKEHKRRSKNWTRIETMKLIRFRSEMQPRFLRGGRKSELWDEISEGLRSEGICRDTQQCKDKWEKLTAGYKEVREGIRDKEDYPFYDELDPLLSVKAQRRETLIRTQLRRQCQGIELPREIEMEISGGEDEFIRSDGEDTEEDTNEFPARKRQRSLNFRNDEMIEAFKDLFDSFLTRQSRLFVDLLESMERREKIREKIRLEREEKWREEDRQHRLMFQNAMTLFMKKIVHEGVRCTSDSAPCHHVNEPASTPIAETDVTTGGGGGGSGGGSAARKRSKNWKRAEVLLLIKLRTEMEGKFAKSTRRAVLWEEVAQLLCAEGVQRDGKQCREKWDKLMAEYKEVSDGKRDRGDSPYFADLLATVTHAGSGSGSASSSSPESPITNINTVLD